MVVEVERLEGVDSSEHEATQGRLKASAWRDGSDAAGKQSDLLQQGVSLRRVKPGRETDGPHLACQVRCAPLARCSCPAVQSR